MFLEDCKYVVKEIKYIIGDIEISSDSCRESSDQERSDKENSDEENSNEKNCDAENQKIYEYYQ